MHETAGTLAVTELDSLEFDTAEVGEFHFESMEEISVEVLEVQPLPPTSTATVAAEQRPIETEAKPDSGIPASECTIEKVHDRIKRMDSFLERLRESREQVHTMRETVAEQAVEAHRLKEQHKAAKDILKESTEELSGMERQLETLEEQWNDGSWANVEVHSIGEESDDDDSDTTPAATANVSIGAGASNQVDPATTAKITVLKITPGRLETLEQAECRTVADLERLMREGGLLKLKGFGAKAIEVVTDRLREWREKNPMPESLVAAVPLVDGQFDQTQFTAGSIACVDGVARNGNPHQHSVGGFAWKSWDAGWVEQCRELGKPMELIDRPDAAPGLTSTVTPGGVAANDPDAETASEPVSGSESEPPAATPAAPANVQDDLLGWPEEDLTPELIDAYRAGSEAGLAGQKVTANPNKKGSNLWHKWDAGWQRSYVPSEDDLL